MTPRRRAASLVLAAAVVIAHAPDAAAARDAGIGRAQSAVRGYLDALHAHDMRAAYDRLTAAQRAYFISAANFASNFDSTAFSLDRYSLRAATARGTGAYQVDVRETFSVRDVATGARLRVTTVEPYFALEEGDRVGVKQIGQPWRAYALDARGRNRGLSVRVARVEYFDHRVQLDCVFHNDSRAPITMLPLLKSTLAIDAAAPVAAFSDARFPLNDKELFKGPVIGPGKGLAGYISFPLAAKIDATQRLTLVIAPALAERAEAPFAVSVGPFELPKH